jgi:hypothetical protein
MPNWIIDILKTWIHVVLLGGFLVTLFCIAAMICDWFDRE